MKLSIVLLCIAASALLASTVSAKQDVRQDILAAQGCAKGEGRDKSTTTVSCFDLPNCEHLSCQQCDGCSLLHSTTSFGVVKAG